MTQARRGIDATEPTRLHRTDLAPEQPQPRPHGSRRPGGLATSMLVTLTLVLALMAGCASSSTDNQAPKAVLSVDKSPTWSGQDVAFDARASKDPDGKLTSWHFDFGDQKTADATSNDTARQEHAYAHGGVYLASVVVTDNGTEGGRAETDSASQRVIVNDREAVTAPALYSSPANVTASSSQRQVFMVYASADHAEAVLNVTSLLAVGESRLTVNVLAPDNTVLASRDVAIPAGQTVAVDVVSGLPVAGNYALDMKAESGAVGISGDLDRYYA